MFKLCHSKAFTLDVGTSKLYFGGMLNFATDIITQIRDSVSRGKCAIVLQNRISVSLISKEAEQTMRIFYISEFELHMLCTYTETRKTRNKEDRRQGRQCSRLARMRQLRAIFPCQFSECRFCRVLLALFAFQGVLSKCPQY